MTTVVVDEASQIEIGNYIPLLSSYSSIRKICFFGDDKQCEFLSNCYVFMARLMVFVVAPFGAEQIPQLQSIFELQHIRQSAVFLNMQCS